MTCVHTITHLLLTSYIVFPTVLPRRLVSLRHELDQHLFTVKVAGTGATDLFWALGWVLSVSTLIDICGKSFFLFLVDRCRHLSQSSITHPSRHICGSFVMAERPRRLVAQCQVHTQLVFAYLCGMGETGENFVREALSRPVPDPRNDMRELLVVTYTLSNSFWGLLNFNIDVFN